MSTCTNNNNNNNENSNTNSNESRDISLQSIYNLNNISDSKLEIVPSPSSSDSSSSSSSSINLRSSSNPRLIIFTYDVIWERSNIKWASRWDVYLKMTDSKIHWFSIINSIMIVLFLSAMVAFIMMRILHRDLTRYNGAQNNINNGSSINTNPNSNDNSTLLNSSLNVNVNVNFNDDNLDRDETGWKLIHGDVFRPPAHGNWFAILIGTGCQLFMMTLFTLIFAALGLLSPANRGKHHTLIH